MNDAADHAAMLLQDLGAMVTERPWEALTLAAAYVLLLYLAATLPRGRSGKDDDDGA